MRRLYRERERQCSVQRSRARKSRLAANWCIYALASAKWRVHQGAKATHASDIDSDGRLRRVVYR